MNENQKYIINVDFRTFSRIHLNSKFFKVDNRCQIREKKKEYGGWVNYSKEQVQGFLEGKEKLFFNDRSVMNLVPCKLCSKLAEFEFRDISLNKEIYDITSENYQEIKKFLKNVKSDICMIVDNLHFLLNAEDLKLKNSFKENLFIFNNSIDIGSELVTKQKYKQGLIDHGFYSPEIERKMGLYQQSRNYEFPKEIEKNVKEEHQSLYARLIGWVKKNLNIINVILGSLSSIVPALGAATEYKETIEHAINYSYA